MFEDFHFAVSEFMREIGFTAMYVKRSGEYDPSKGGIVEIEKLIPIRAVLLDLTLRSNGLGIRPNTEIQQGDKQLYVQPTEQTEEGRPPLIVEPTKDSVRVGSIEYKIVTSKEYNLTGTEAILYELYIRR